jgi:hypothetical protein
VKKVFISSGIRFDYVLADKDETFLSELCEYHVSGQLRVAPEHVSNAVLKRMGKPSNEVYQEFGKRFDSINKHLNKEQYMVPYLMSSHPGSTLKEAVELAEYVRDMGYMPEQVQDFYPTPSTIATCIYYTGFDPATGEKVYVPKSAHEKAMQRALIQYRNPKNYALVMEALREAGRLDLVGFEKHCLIRPRQLRKEISGNDGKRKDKDKNKSKDKSKDKSKGISEDKSKDKNGLPRVARNDGQSKNKKQKNREKKNENRKR